MGRPQSPLERDGTPVREFAFWLRDLRNRSGLTYTQLARSAHYATSTMQDAAAGQRLPTLKVVKAFVTACSGNLAAWEAYWSQIRRLLDSDLPPEISRSVAPPWANGAGYGPSAPGAARQAPGRAAAESGQPAFDDSEGWYVESFSALLRLDTEPIEAVEQRVAVATVDGLSELSTSISVPRHPEDSAPTHRLNVELLHGGSLELREQPYESFFRNVIALPEPLRTGDRHEYALRLRIPPGQPMATHYVHVPLRRSDYFDLRVRFSLRHLPRTIWKLSGVPPAVIYERNPASETMRPDRFGEVHVTFRDLRPGLGYGLMWQDGTTA
ncbi:MAG TPA: helix-turn-helix domain-containing protein [Streptosporangiaceae bacterium]|nr:helix-turn-helix domain-containing protein [Streptosporangiaceae bacterium]